MSAFFPASGIAFASFSTGILVKKLVILTDKIDSLDRSFVKKGFSITSGARDPVGFFTDTVEFPNEQAIIFRMPFANMSEEKDILREYGAVITDIVLSVPSIGSIREICERDSIEFNLGEDSALKTMTLLGTEPLSVTIVEGPAAATDTSITHPNGVFRIDWILLSASADVEKKLRALFSALDILAFHEGCCDYWRLGMQDDFTMVRFEPPLKMKPLQSNWLGIEGGNIYYAY